MLQPIDRQEIIVIDNAKKKAVAIDPATGLPLFFVFVDNTSSSNGTIESPYPTLAQAQTNSGPNDIIYVFPGNGTTTGMEDGITLQANQKFWGSGTNHPLQTSQGKIAIPAQSSTSPTITNTNFETLGDAITLATNNEISGFIIRSALHDAIFGTDPQNLNVSSCTFEDIQTFVIEASCSDDTFISITNNQCLGNMNGIFLTLNGTSTVVCSDNTFKSQISSSEFPLDIVAVSNTFSAHIENNLFDDNETGSIQFDLTDVINANIIVLNNTITNNRTGAKDSLGSSFVITQAGTSDFCSILLEGNTFSGNASNSLYIPDQATITDFQVTASGNTMSNNGHSALAFGCTCTTFTLNATNNTITGLNDNGISTVGGTPFQIANITINNNNITDISNGQTAIILAQGSSILNFTAENNAINNCTGSGILCFSSEFTNVTANILGNVISNCQNVGAENAGSGISVDTYVNLTSTITNNTLTNNVSPSVAIGTLTSGNPAVCLTLIGNSTDMDYFLANPVGGLFNLSPCNVDDVNVGTITFTSGTITPVKSCPGATPCP